jgi:DNA-binding XRE family transcriptional regulator
MNIPVKWIYDETGKPESAVIPKRAFNKLLALAENAGDIQAIRDFNASHEETFPAEWVDRLIEGENPVKVYREYRQLTQSKLGEKAGLDQSYINQIEKGKRKGTAKSLKKIAAVLNIDVDLLIY